MGQTLQEMLESDGFGMGSEKVASQQDLLAGGGDDGLNKLAAELGLVDEFAPATVPAANVAADTNVPADTFVSEKVASEDALSGLYNEMFPDDVSMGGTEKTAEQQKVAESEEVLGAMSYDAFSDRFDQRVEKLAMAVMSGNATVSAPAASVSGGNPHGDSRPPQTQPQNRPADAANAINTTPDVENILPPQSGAHVTGQETPGKKATEKTAAALAFRKFLLLSNVTA